MEKDVVYIDEKNYQKIKNEIGKKEDKFTKEEYEILSKRYNFNAIFNATPIKSYKKI